MEEYEVDQAPAGTEGMEESALLDTLLHDGEDAPADEGSGQRSEPADAPRIEEAWDAPHAQDADGADAPEGTSGTLWEEGEAGASDASEQPPELQTEEATAPPPEAAQQTLELALQRAQQQDAEELMRQGVPRNTAMQLAAERAQMARERAAIAPLLRRQQAEQERSARLEPWREMTKYYPGISHLPESVLQNVMAGETPLNAMRAWENAQLRAELSAQKLQLAAQKAALHNRRTAPGSASGAADAKRDAFLDELFG